MSLENQIKQQKFGSEAQKAIVNIAFTHSYFAGLFNSSLKKHNVSMQQFNVLRILKGQHPKPVSINDITDRMIDKMSNASRLVEKLRIKGFIKRSTCTFDKRQVDIFITNEGIDALTNLNHIIDEVIGTHSHIEENEFRNLNITLDRLRKD